MSLSTTFCTICLLSSIALGAPTTNTLQGRSFEVERIRRSDYVPNGPAALRKAYGKFNIKPIETGFQPLDFKPIDTAEAVQQAANAGNGADGVVSATSVNNDAEFVSPVTIGGQTLMMDFDTGSSDL